MSDALVPGGYGDLLAQITRPLVVLITEMGVRVGDACALPFSAVVRRHRRRQLLQHPGRRPQAWSASSTPAAKARSPNHGREPAGPQRPAGRLREPDRPPPDQRV